MFLEPLMVLTVSPLLPDGGVTEGSPMRVEVRSAGPGGHAAGLSPSIVMLERLLRSVGPLHTPDTWMMVGLAALGPLGAALTAAWRVLKTCDLPLTVTRQVPVAN